MADNVFNYIGDLGNHPLVLADIFDETESFLESMRAMESVRDGESMHDSESTLTTHSTHGGDFTINVNNITVHIEELHENNEELEGRIIRALLGDMAVIANSEVMNVIDQELNADMFVENDQEIDAARLNRIYEEINAALNDEVEGNQDQHVHGVDSDTIPNVVLRSNLMDGETRCVVCQENFLEGETVKRVEECTHMFHVPCIETWLQSNCTCPVCRRWLCEHTHEQQQ